MSVKLLEQWLEQMPFSEWSRTPWRQPEEARQTYTVILGIPGTLPPGTRVLVVLNEQGVRTSASSLKTQCKTHVGMIGIIHPFLFLSRLFFLFFCPDCCCRNRLSCSCMALCERSAVHTSRAPYRLVCYDPARCCLQVLYWHRYIAFIPHNEM
jgi:hypothetical protein